MAYEICHLVISFMLFSDISRSFVSCAPSVLIPFVLSVLICHLVSYANFKIPWHMLCYIGKRER